MAEKKPVKPAPGAPQICPAKGLVLLQSQIEKSHNLLSSHPFNDDDYKAWQLLTRNYLEKAFGAGSPIISAVMSAGLGSSQFPLEDLDIENYRRRRLKSQVRQLEASVELLQTGIQTQQSETDLVPELGCRVFLVHGHDKGIRSEVARVLAKLRHDPIVLEEQPRKGRTTIEKFEDCASDVGFVVVLLTPDDQGGLVGKAHETQQPRARQNVVFELGYFIGRLGRDRVCALYAPNVEIPSDYSGVQYISLDSAGAWRLELAREMKAAGLDVDMNDL